LEPSRDDFFKKEPTFQVSAGTERSSTT
jgi:hypothetical protein